MEDAIRLALFYLLQAVIIIVGAYLVILGQQAAKWLRKKIGEEDWNLLKEITEDIVEAMEQKFGPGTGPVKKEHAMRILTQIFHLDEQTADALIEAVVFELNYLWGLKNKEKEETDIKPGGTD